MNEYDIPNPEETIDVIERAFGAISPNDDYGEAILQSQKHIIGLLNAQSAGGVDVTTSVLPIGAVGTAMRKINPGASGPAVFTLAGTEYRVTVQADQLVYEDQDVVVAADPNMVVPASEVEVTSAGTSIRGTGPIAANTADPGEENAVQLSLGGHRQNFDIAYRTTANTGHLHIEHSPDGSEWFHLYQKDAGTFTLEDGVAEDTIQGSTMFPYVRAFFSEDFAAEEIDALTIGAKGV